MKFRWLALSVYFKLFQRWSLFPYSAPQQQLLKKNSSSLSGVKLTATGDNAAVRVQLPVLKCHSTGNTKEPKSGYIYHGMWNISISAFSRKLESHDIYSFGPCQSYSRPCKGSELAAINGWKTRCCSPSTWKWAALFQLGETMARSQGDRCPRNKDDDQTVVSVSYCCPPDL